LFRKKYTFEQVEKIFKSRGYTLLSNTYVNNRTPLDYICSKGHLHKIRLDDLLHDKHCPYCLDSYTRTLDQVREEVSKNGEKLISTTFSNSRSYIDVECVRGHTYRILYNSYQQGHGCRYCQYEDLKDLLTLSLEEVKQELKGYKLNLISDYINTKENITYECALGHIETKSLEDLRRRRHKCTACYLLDNIGENHHNYINGEGLSGYCPIWSDKGYKADIRLRDNNICQNPYCYKTDKMLSIHHVDYNKKNCHPSNLITVCRSCNGKANKDREWHTKWYQEIMSKKFNYAY
jgi:hypothetical protein